VIGTFQEAGYFSAATARRYAELADDAVLVAALGVDMADEPAPGVWPRPRRRRAAAWRVGRGRARPHFGVAFVARDLGDGRPDRDRRFDFALTHDRELVTEVARSMMRRLAA
jgi:hypothetical protein